MIPPKNQGEKIDKVIFADIKNFYYGTKTLDDKISESEGEFYGSLIGSSFGVITTSYGINKAKSIINSSNGVDKLGTIKTSSNKFVEPQKYSFDIAKASKNGEKISDVSKNITDKVETPKIKSVEDIIGTKTGNKKLNNAINTRGKEYYLKQLDEKKAPVFATISDEKLTSFQNEANRLPYNPVLKSPVKYPNLTDSENKFLNDYMNKEIPGKIVSKYNDVNKYEYNATTNPGPLSIGGDDPPIKNFYGGMYNDASNESGIFVRMGDKIKPYGSWYTKVSKNSEAQARVDLAIKKWWVKPNGEIKIRGFETEKSILDTMYYIKFPEGIPKYKGPVGYQGGPFLGGLDQEQYFIPDSWEYGEIIETYPVK